MENSLEKRVIGFLFAAGEYMSRDKIARALSESRDVIDSSIPSIRATLEGTGIALAEHNDLLELVTDPSISDDIEGFIKKEETGDLGTAAMETLSIILYSGPISKREIDYIRGVNSGYILRSLLIRGLIEKGTIKEGERSTIYQPTLELLGYLGIQNINELPDYEEVVNEVRKITQTIQEQQ